MRSVRHGGGCLSGTPRSLIFVLYRPSLAVLGRRFYNGHHVADEVDFRRRFNYRFEAAKTTKTTKTENALGMTMEAPPKRAGLHHSSLVSATTTMWRVRSHSEVIYWPPSLSFSVGTILSTANFPSLQNTRPDGDRSGSDSCLFKVYCYYFSLFFYVIASFLIGSRARLGAVIAGAIGIGSNRGD